MEKPAAPTILLIGSGNVASSLFGEGLAQSGQRGVQGRRRNGSGALGQAGFIHGAYLIEQDEAILAAMPDGNVKGRGMGQPAMARPMRTHQSGPMAAK